MAGHLEIQGAGVGGPPTHSPPPLPPPLPTQACDVTCAASGACVAVQGGADPLLASCKCGEGGGGDSFVVNVRACFVCISFLTSYIDA